jgi:hypothetical protein
VVKTLAKKHTQAVEKHKSQMLFTKSQIALTRGVVECAKPIRVLRASSGVRRHSDTRVVERRNAGHTLLNVVTGCSRTKPPYWRGNYRYTESSYVYIVNVVKGILCDVRSIYRSRFIMHDSCRFSARLACVFHCPTIWMPLFFSGFTFSTLSQHLLRWFTRFPCLQGSNRGDLPIYDKYQQICTPVTPYS